jgi:hypothetical protein
MLPNASIVATAMLLELQVIARPVSVLPDASRSVAVAEVVPFGAITDAPRLTDTVATETAVTVNVALPATPSLVAVMFVVPVPTGVTTPEVFTVATAVFVELHAIVRPWSALPPASRVVAVAVTDWPSPTLVALNETLTDATLAWTTVMFAVTVLPEADAVICAVPGETAVTNPLDETVATAVFDEAQVIAMPFSDPPDASRAIAPACTV